MKLSEAIRLGSMLRQQGFGQLWDGLGRSCALGAAYEAGGLLQAARLSDPEVTQAFPMLRERADCPVCAVYSCPMKALVAHLNDDHKWTREAIADWVEGIEAQSPLTAVVSVELVAVE